jgi:hypothetical protein
MTGRKLVPGEGKLIGASHGSKHIPLGPLLSFWRIYLIRMDKTAIFGWMGCLCVANQCLAHFSLH